MLYAYNTISSLKKQTFVRDFYSFTVLKLFMSNTCLYCPFYCVVAFTEDIHKTASEPSESNQLCMLLY